VQPFEIDPLRVAGIEVELIDEDSSKVPAPSTAPPPPARGWKLWSRLLAGGAGLFLVGALGVEAYDFVADLLSRSVLLGWTFGALLAAAAAGAVGIAGREIGALRRLERVAELRKEAKLHLDSRVHGEVDGLIGRIEALYRGRPDVEAALERFRTEASDALDDGERLTLFARTVLEPLDRRAYRIVTRAGRDIGALTALSPLGLLDGAIVLARTFAMLREVARHYGVRPAAAASWSLFKEAVRNVLAAGVADLAADAAVETVGSSLLSVLSARAGQGVLNGVLAARLGLGAMELCRPLPFRQDEMPSVKRLRAELLASKTGAA
jgi:putative membrane protein